jgi:hypothetical protein
LCICFVICPSVSCCSSHIFHLCCCYSSGVPCFNSPYNKSGRASVLYNFIRVFLRIYFWNWQIFNEINNLIEFLYNKTNQMHQFPKVTPAWNSACFGEFLCPSSGVYLLYTRHWYMSYRFGDSFRAGAYAVYKPVWHIPVPSVQWINSWWCAEELPETCRVSYRSKFGKPMHLVGFIVKKFVTMHGHVNVKKNLIEKCG